jgi:CheY-like chemotaxis protein
MRQSTLEIEGPALQDGVGELADFRSSGEGLRILIADDDPSIVRLLAGHCARLGFNVETATNGLKALLKANRFKPDILVVDVNMPEVDGLSVCEHLLNPDRPPLNVIVITGSSHPDTLERCESFGAYYARKGPNFWIELEAALVEIDPAMAARSHHADARAPEVRKRPCVLLIDDDGDVNRFLSSRLEKCGLDVKYASDATQGFRVACSDEPAVIVTDYFMPNGDAQYLLTRLRTTPATENIPVIVLSGRQLSSATEQNLRREIRGHPGAAQILVKSPDTHLLFEALKKFSGFEQSLPGTEK